DRGEDRGGGYQAHQVETGRLPHHQHGEQGPAPQHQQLQQQLRWSPPPPQAPRQLQAQPQRQAQRRVADQQLIGQAQPAPVLAGQPEGLHDGQQAPAQQSQGDQAER
ncbi:MAG: hypothetical protein ACK56I_13075, partial [bacterium]